VLVLSRFAGAARQMPEAVIVNPYSREEMSEALRTALTMGRPERIRRWERLIAGVRGSDVKAWRDDFVGALKAAREPPLPLFAATPAAMLREVTVDEPDQAGAIPRTTELQSHRRAQRRGAGDPFRAPPLRYPEA
jgi:trehalose 6-phosphate synthase